MRIRAWAVTLGLAFGAAAHADDGQKLFEQSCGLCHQQHGEGMPNVAPPLMDKTVWSALGNDASRYLVGVMLVGLSGTLKTSTGVYSGIVMPPQDRMTNDELASIGTYVLQKLNGLDIQLSSEQLATARANSPTHSELRALRAKSRG